MKDTIHHRRHDMNHSNQRVVMNEDVISNLIDATFDSGYYQATMEKLQGQLSDGDYAEYTRLNAKAIARREKLRSQLLNKLR